MTQQLHSWVYIQKNPKNTNLKRHMHTNVNSNFIYSFQGVERS